MKADDLFTAVTERIIADIEAGAPTWQMPWRTLADAGTPTSLDGRRYRGLNALWLPLVSIANDWTSGVFGTYVGWRRHGAQVRRGEHGTSVVLWKPTEHNTDDREDGEKRPSLFATTYTVFSAEQVDGSDPVVERQTRVARDTAERLTDAEAYFAAIGATVTEAGNRAFYRPATDTITIPALAQFDTPADYYATRAHESIHWTGHETRLARDLSGHFGDDAYAAEELVAELGAAMWCAQARISSTPRPDHAAYLSSWLRVLRAEPRSLITVASKAQAALDWLNHTAGTDSTADDPPAEAT